MCIIQLKANQVIFGHTIKTVFNIDYQHNKSFVTATSVLIIGKIVYV